MVRHDADRGQNGPQLQPFDVAQKQLSAPDNPQRAHGDNRGDGHDIADSAFAGEERSDAQLRQHHDV